MQWSSSGPHEAEVHAWQVNTQQGSDAPPRLVRQDSGPDSPRADLRVLGPTLATADLALPGACVLHSIQACLLSTRQFAAC